jgi:hypothetical protein
MKNTIINVTLFLAFAGVITLIIVQQTKKNNEVPDFL